MDIFLTGFLYTFMFLVLYFQVFLILTLLESRSKISDEGERSLEKDHPTVTIIVPIFNEEKTVAKTVLSLLAMNYPHDKLSVMVVDDGSKDNTWEIVQQFKDNPRVLLHRKENGGKYTALNYAIEHSTSEYIGCLDADSFVDPDALNYILPYFEEEGVMAVTPSLKIQNADSVLGMIQNAEYHLGIFTRKILGMLDAQYVTPGPFSIFKKEVFEKVGPYRHAHNTEDLEMALRLQDHNFKIKNAHKALVHTVAPRTLYKLYKQRVRWTGGFIQNTIDYRKMILNPKYGNLGLLVLPLAMYSIIGSLIFLAMNLYTTAVGAYQSFEKARIVGLDWSFFNAPSFTKEWLLYNVQSSLFLGILAIGTIVFAIWYGKRLAGIKESGIMDIVYFLLLYSLISPLWLITSVYNTVRNRDAAWR